MLWVAERKQNYKAKNQQKNSPEHQIDTANIDANVKITRQNCTGLAPKS